MLQKGVPINLPITEDPERTPDTEKQLQISVKGEGIVYLGPTAVRKEQVDRELIALGEIDHAAAVWAESRGEIQATTSMGGRDNRRRRGHRSTRAPICVTNKSMPLVRQAVQ